MYVPEYIYIGMSSVGVSGWAWRGMGVTGAGLVWVCQGKHGDDWVDIGVYR